MTSDPRGDWHLSRSPQTWVSTTAYNVAVSGLWIFKPRAVAAARVRRRAPTAHLEDAPRRGLQRPLQHGEVVVTHRHTARPASGPGKPGAEGPGPNGRRPPTSRTRNFLASSATSTTSPTGRCASSHSRQACVKGSFSPFDGATSISSKLSCASAAATQAARSARRRTASVAMST
jgi:hypothetical protein